MVTQTVQRETFKLFRTALSRRRGRTGGGSEFTGLCDAHSWYTSMHSLISICAGWAVPLSAAHLQHMRNCSPTLSGYLEEDCVCLVVCGTFWSLAAISGTGSSFPCIEIFCCPSPSSGTNPPWLSCTATKPLNPHQLSFSAL